MAALKCCYTFFCKIFLDFNVGNAKKNQEPATKNILYFALFAKFDNYFKLPAVAGLNTRQAKNQVPNTYFKLSQLNLIFKITK